MKATPQYRVSFPYKYNRIIHNIEKKYARTQDIGQTNGKMHLILRIKKLCNSLKSTFPNSLKVKHLTIYLYTARSWCQWATGWYASSNNPNYQTQTVYWSGNGLDPPASGRSMIGELPDQLWNCPGNAYIKSRYSCVIFRCQLQLEEYIIVNNNLISNSNNICSIILKIAIHDEFACIN